MKINRVEKLTHERWVNLFAADYEHNGHEGRWVFASRRDNPHVNVGCDAVVIVPILRNPGEPPRLVLIREFRVPVAQYMIGLPAGIIEPGEALEESICREILEETGYQVTAIHRISPPLFSSAGLTDESAAIAFIDVQGHPDSKQTLEASEDIEVVLADYAKICELCRDSSLRFDVKAWTILCMYEQMGKIL